MALLFLEAIGPDAERIATDAANAAGVAVGYDAELGSGTFDSDAHDEDALRTLILEALAAVDPDWDSHLQPVA